LFTNPETKEFSTATPNDEKLKLSKQWKDFMTEEDSWISFFEWKKLQQKPIVQMVEESSESSTPKHKWKGIDGSIIQSNSVFPPFKGIVLEDNSKQVRAIPLLLSEEATQLSGIDKRVQSVAEQVNWTNTALKGMATNIFVTNDYARKEQIYDLQVSTNTIVRAVD